MTPTHLFELVIAMFVAIIVLHYLALRLGLPPSVALLVGGASLAFLPGVPAIAIDPELVLVIFLPPLLLDGAWSVSLDRLRRHLIGITSLAVGAVLFTTVAVALVTHWLFPTLPWAACAVLGAIVSPPDAVSARAVLQRVKLPRRLQILLEGESLLNDASGLVLFRFAIAAGVTGAFSAVDAAGSFVLLALGGVVAGALTGMAWVMLVRRLGDDYLIIAGSGLVSWASYLLGEKLGVSGVIATVTAGLVMSWHQHELFSAAIRMRGAAFWKIVIFLMEASVFILIGLSLRDIVERGGGFTQVFAGTGWPILAILVTLTLARFIWVFGSDQVIRICNKLGWTRHRPLGTGASTVLAWAGVRGVVTLALALSVPEGFPGRDFIVVASFAVIMGTVLIQGTTLGRIIAWTKPVEVPAERAQLAMSQAEAAMAKAQLETIEKLAYGEDGTLLHPRLLERYQRRAAMIDDYVERTDHYTPLLQAHFEVVLAVIATARRELIRLHRSGQIDDETLRELEHDLDLEELSAIAAKS